jgi:uncharacterized protein
MSSGAAAMTLKALALLTLALLLSSCTLDFIVLNEKKVDRYDLSSSLIPDSSVFPVTFSSGGHTLYGFYVQRFPVDTTRMWVLYFHGNASHLGGYWTRTGWLYEMGFNVLIFDYRGFGRSEGDLTQDGLYEDGRAALHFMMVSLHVPPERLILYGYSLGNVAATYLASEAITPRFVIAEAPFASADALASDVLPLHVPAEFVLNGTYDIMPYVRRLHSPLLLIHGDRDLYVPFRTNGQVVYDAAPDPKELELVPGAGHDDIPDVLGYETYRNVIVTFLWSYAETPRPGH